MTTIWSVEYLARQYVGLVNDPHFANAEAEEVDVRSAEFNFKVNGFNAATVATISLVALAILTGSILLSALALLTYSVRGAFLKSVMITGRRPREQVHELLELNRRDVMADFLRIHDHTWQPVSYQILDFILWMNGAPSLSPMPVEQEEGI